MTSRSEQPLVPVDWNKPAYWWRDSDAVFWRPRGTTRTHLVVPEFWDYSLWAKGADALQEFGAAYPFWIGDMFLEGERRFGEAWTQAIRDDLNINLDTLRKYMWVCDQVPPEIRRETLTFSHHQLVAKSTLDLEDKQLLLNQAEANRLSVNDFKVVVAEYLKARDEPEPEPVLRGTEPEPVTVTHRVRCPGCQHEFDYEVGL